MNRVQFGWVVPVEGTTPGSTQPLLATYEAEILPAFAQHFDSFWAFDHFYGFGGYPTRSFMECWTTLTWLAARYPKQWIGPVVMGVGYRNPALVAKMGASLQALSGGRFVLGIGAGWREEEFHAYGYPFPTSSARIAQLEEAIQIIRLMWTESAPSFQGKYFQIAEAYCPPMPVPPPPIMVGGAGEQLMLPLIARLADWWNIGDMPDLATYRHKRDLLFRNLEKIGRDPATLRLTVQRAGKPLPESREDSQRWVDELLPFVEMGFSTFMLDFGLVPSTEPVERFWED
ncbi:MAG TPA: LLM class flavin-dependent oxidoreductase, partial [Anaerolineaceae bacterium]|nr:LLM class flavin-dependent oxidoreductase [Anaerolineaceae bacterium]